MSAENLHTIYKAAFAIASENPKAITDMADILKAKYENFEAHYTTLPNPSGAVIVSALFRWDTTKAEHEGWSRKMQLSNGKEFA